MILPLKILLIDECRDDRAALRECLTRSGRPFVLYEASSGETGLKWFKAMRPHCVVIDLKLTGVIGTEVLNSINTSTIEAVPLFIWTELSHPLLQKDSPMLGIQGYFDKTKDSEERLVQAILEAVVDKDNGVEG